MKGEHMVPGKPDNSNPSITMTATYDIRLVAPSILLRSFHTALDLLDGHSSSRRSVSYG